MNTYNITPEFLKENLIEIQIDKTNVSYNMLETQLKTKLTREYNKRFVL
jgi:hypothetical protein